MVDLTYYKGKGGIEVLMEDLLDEDTWPLDELIVDLQIEGVKNYYNCSINNITNNSNNVRYNSLFVAINGFKVDGHQYIFQAISNGAVAVVGEEDIKTPDHIPYIKVKNSRRALAKLISIFYNHPDQSLRLIGVTGTAGKTTTTKMIDNILNQVVEETGLIGTLHTKIGENYYANPDHCTTPDAPVLHKSLKEMVKEGSDYATMEVSSHSLKLDRVWGLDFDIAIFTNLSYDHLEFHNTLQDYYRSKERLFSNLRDDKFALLNADDDYFNSLVESMSANYYSYGINSQADITAENIDFKLDGIKFDLKINKEINTLLGKKVEPISLKIKLSLLGYHNIYNALAAFIAGVVLGIPINKIKEGLESFTGVKRRMELIYNKEFTIIDDFAHNPISLRSNFKTIEKFNYNKLVILHFLKGKRGVEANKMNARVMVEWKDKLRLKEIITTKSEAGVISKNKVLPEEEEAFLNIIKDSEVNVISNDRLFPAIKNALQKVDVGDLLLVVGGPGLDDAKEIISKLL